MLAGRATFPQLFGGGRKDSDSPLRASEREESSQLRAIGCPMRGIRRSQVRGDAACLIFRARHR
jgi:hypothetical protein